MKTILIVTLVCGLLTGCTSATPFGKCVGINGVEDPNLRYEYDAKNIVIAGVFFELIAPPVFVLLDETRCPVARISNGTR